MRNPGQSLDEQIRDLISDYAFGPLVFALFMILITALEWLKYSYSLPPKPWLYSSIAIPSLCYAVWRFFGVKSEVRNRGLGRDGEKAVGQFLEKLRERGYQVFHDVIGQGFNVDHVLIGPAGVFTVETKTYSKARGGSRVVFNGETIRIDDVKPDRDLAIQAKAQASWLRQTLADSTGRQFAVKSVIVFPGWYVENTGPKNKALWVLEPKMLPTFLDHDNLLLSTEDIHLASYHQEMKCHARVKSSTERTGSL